MESLKKPKRIKAMRIWHILFGITFFTSGCIVNIIQCLLYFTVFRFSKYYYRKINYYLSYFVYSQFVFLSDWWGNVKMTLHARKEDYTQYYGTEHSYLIMNHSWDIDWFFGWILCDRVGVLGNAKAYAKKAIKYLPVIGPTWTFGEFVFLTRSWEKDQDILGSQITELADHPDPIWFLLFAEGTRFTKEKHESSVKYSIERGLPELKYHLQPRTKGFLASLPNMRGKIACILDIEVAFHVNGTKRPPKVMDIFNGEEIDGHMYVRRIPLEDVPLDDEGASKFLRDLYVRKDKLRENFDKTGRFDSSPDIAKVDIFEPPIRPHALINFVFWACVVLIPIASYLLNLVITGNWYSLGIATTIITIICFIMNIAIAMSDSEKGSSYGKEVPKKAA